SEGWEDILDQLRQTPHTRLPVYEGELDNLIGLLHMKRVAHELVRGTLSRERLIEIARGRESYFVPEGTALNVQPGQFQRNPRRRAPNPRWRLRARRERRLQRLAHACHREHREPGERFARRIVARHDRDAKPLRARFAQPLVPVGDRAYLAGEPELPEGHELGR